MGRDIFYYPRVLQAPSNQVWSIFRVGTATTSLGTLCQGITTLTGRNSFPISHLTLLCVLPSLVESLSMCVVGSPQVSVKEGASSQQQSWALMWLQSCRHRTSSGPGSLITLIWFPCRLLPEEPAPCPAPGSVFHLCLCIWEGLMQGINGNCPEAEIPAIFILSNS